MGSAVTEVHLGSHEVRECRGDPVAPRGSCDTGLMAQPESPTEQGSPVFL